MLFLRRFYALLVCLGVVLSGRPVEAAVPIWSYRILAMHGGSLLQVGARIEHPRSLDFSVADGAEPFVGGVQVYHDGHWQSIRPRGVFWKMPPFAAGGCLVRYEFNVAAAARRVDRMGLAQRHGAVYHVCPEAFLLRPCDDEEAHIVFHVATTDHTRFLTGYRHIGRCTWTCMASDLPLGPDAAFGPLQVLTIHVRGTSITLGYTGMPLSADALRGWIRRESTEVARYFGGFPTNHLLVLMLPVAGDGTEGHARGGGASVCLCVGRKVTGAELMGDTVYVHELVHVCTPALPPAWHWMEEGIATYLERIIPAQAGDLSPQQVWLGMIEDLPKGLPEPGDSGLNRAADDNRIYFGGALYWLLADIQIQVHSHGRHSLQDVMRTMHRHGASIARIWNVHRVLALGETATGVDVLKSLYSDMAFTDHRPDLTHLWKQLGISQHGARLSLHRAPLSSVRRALTPNPPLLSVLRRPSEGATADTLDVFTQWLFGIIDYLEPEE